LVDDADDVAIVVRGNFLNILREHMKEALRESYRTGASLWD